MDRHRTTSRCFWLSRGSDSDSDSDNDSGSANKKIRKTGSSRFKRVRSQDHYELKDMRKLDSNDEAFLLSSREIREIIDIIDSRKTPTPKTYMQWDEYEASFYLKMCTCFGVDYQHLEAEDENGMKNQRPTAFESNSVPFQLPIDMFCEIKSRMEITGVEKTQSLTKEECLEKESRLECTGVEFDPKTHLSKKEEHVENILPMEFTGVEKNTQSLTNEEEHLKNLMRMKCTSVMPIRSGPLDTGCYSPGNEPDRIPYHLYLLVKEAVDIMKCNDVRKLQTVEEKIRFFCTYFHSHLPTGLEYEQDNASSLIADYDTMRRPKYLMTGYTPFKDLNNFNMDVKTGLTEQEMADVMSIIHSRKTPTFAELTWHEISFYCKLCSCFGIDYHELEVAFEDDVCLMNMGRNG